MNALNPLIIYKLFTKSLNFSFWVDGQSTYQNLQDYPLVTPMDTSSDISTFDTKVRKG